MAQYVEVNGQNIEFPDGMSVSDIESALKKNALSLPAAPVSKREFADNALSGQAPVANMMTAIDNLRGGGIRGAGSIGSTILWPIDKATDLVQGDRSPSVSGLVTGQQPVSRNDERRASIDSGLQTMGFDPESRAYKAGKLGMEIAGTAGMGSLLAKGLSAVPWMAQNAAPLIDAIGSSGFTAGGVDGLKGLLLRTFGGAVSGGASAGLIDPKDAATGAAIGGAAPAVVMGAGKLGSYVGDAIKDRQAAAAADLARKQPLNDTLRAGLDAGYVVPPSSVNPTLSNNIKESISGKVATAQIASSKNQAVTDSLVRKSLGLADDAPLSVEALGKYRADLHAAGYEPLRQIGVVPADAQFASDLNNIVKQYTGKGTIPAIQKTEVNDLVAAHRSSAFDSGDAVDAIRILREDAKDAYRKGDSALGGAQKALANAYEGALERALPTGSDLLKNYQNARQNIAKSFTVEDALKEGTGAVDARKLAAALQKGDPLSGDLLTAARFANAFPKATQPPSMVAGPGVHNLKAMFAGGAGATGGALGAAVAGPPGAAVGSALGAGTAYLLPSAMRLQMFSPSAQRALLPQALGGPGITQQVAGLLADPALQQQVLRTSPVAIKGLLNVD